MNETRIIGSEKLVRKVLFGGFPQKCLVKALFSFSYCHLHRAVLIESVFTGKA